MVARICTVVVVLLCCSTVILEAFLQNDYIIDFYRVEIPFAVDKYVSNAKAITYKYNRTQPAVNVSFNLLMDYGLELEVIAQADKFVSNEYRDFPIHFQFNLCEGLKENHFGLGDLYKCGKFPECPMVKGNYSAGNWYPDPTRFPPFIPNGKYRLSLDMMYRDVKILVAVGYAEVLRPLNMKRKKN